MVNTNVLELKEEELEMVCGGNQPYDCGGHIDESRRWSLTPGEVYYVRKAVMYHYEYEKIVVQRVYEQDTYNFFGHQCSETRMEYYDNDGNFHDECMPYSDMYYCKK